MYTPRDFRSFSLLSPGSALVHCALVFGALLFNFGCGGSATTADPTSSDGGSPATGGQATTSGGTTADATGAPLEEGAACTTYEDSCRPTLSCQIVGDGTRCAKEGSSERDERCEESPCQRGSVCHSDGYDDTCQQPCTLDGVIRCDLPRHTCFAAVDAHGNELPFGVCRY